MPIPGVAKWWLVNDQALSVVGLHGRYHIDLEVLKRGSVVTGPIAE